MRQLKICAYVQESYGKEAYKLECMDRRQFVGLRVIIDCLERAGYTVDYAGIASVHRYDIVLVSLTADCDWWSFISERMRWQRGDYQVLIGGAGVLHVTPFLPFGDYFMLGRGEHLIAPLVDAIARDERFEHESVICAETFRSDRIYRIAQTAQPYAHRLALSPTRNYQEDSIGCNHRCLFCGYTWHRRFVANASGTYRGDDGLFGSMADVERAMLDLDAGDPVDFARLRTTAIDGMSERLRRMVGKPITRRIMVDFLRTMTTSESLPHQLKLYNIVGYPTETEEDWREYLETLREADSLPPRADGRQWAIVLHSTPFRAMPATPMACAPMSKRNYRGRIGKVLGPTLRGNLIYQGQRLWSVESMGTDGLSSVMLSAIAHRGEAEDTESIRRLCANRKFFSANGLVREATLCRYFDMDRLFGPFSRSTLPSRYLRTWAEVEKMWPEDPAGRA